MGCATAYPNLYGELGHIRREVLTKPQMLPVRTGYGHTGQQQILRFPVHLCIFCIRRITT